jgi:undecaprenyl pyrophosphate synthase
MRDRSRQDVAQAVDRVRHSLAAGTISEDEVDTAFLQANLQTQVRYGIPLVTH